MGKSNVIQIKEERSSGDTDANSDIKRALQYRENRISLTENGAAFVEITEVNGHKLKAQVLDISRFGARVLLDEENTTVYSGNNKFDARITIKGNKVFDGQILIVNEIKKENQKLTLGVAFEGQGVDTDQIVAILTNDIETTGLISSKKLIELSSLVRDDFKILVADLNTLFQDLKLRLSEEAEKIKLSAKTENHKMRLEEQIIQLALSLFVEDIHHLFHKFKKITDTLNFDETVMHKRYFRSNFHPLVLGAPFVARGFNKPLGYAGDYGLMVMLYEYYDAGSNLFEKFFHRFSCNEPSAVANKNRVEFIASLLTEEFDRCAKSHIDEVFKVSSLACGPAKEIEIFLNDVKLSDERMIATICVDQEERALEYAQSKIKPLTLHSKKRAAQFFKEDVVLSLIKNRSICADLKNSHVIVCAGLFDYLSDRVATKLIESMYNLVEPGGFMLIGNVSTDNPDKFSMDYFAEWNLILRNSDQLAKLTPNQIISSGAQVEVISESLGINLFLKVTKPNG